MRYVFHQSFFLFLFAILVPMFLVAQQEVHRYTAPTLRPPKPSNPPRPWAKAALLALPPGVPGKDYTPAVVPNGRTAPYRIVNGIKIFHLIAEPIKWELAEGLEINTWGYNGSVPGPMIEVAEGDRVRIYVTNKLPAPTSVHWHGVLLPCGMDGVAGVTQPPIPPGETFVYEFIFPNSGTFMYHPHYDPMTQEGVGLIGMIVVHKRILDPKDRPDRDFVILLHEMLIAAGTARPNIYEMGDFNILTMNGKVMPATEPLVAKLGDRVWIRFGNLSAMDHHPIHLHGHRFKTIGTDGGWAEYPSILLPEATVLVPAGTCQVIDFIADNPGDWIFHCHMTHHTMNQMASKIPNVLNMEIGDLDEKISRLIPGYKTMGIAGMRDMTKMGRPIPANSIPMLGYDKQFGQTVFGGMANILKVREKITSYEDPGPYVFPKGTVAWPATQEELQEDGIHLE